MAIDAAHRRLVAAPALVAADDLHQRRFADDDGHRRRQIVAHILHQPQHAGAADLLIIGKGEVKRRLQIEFRHALRMGKGAGDEAFHVRRTASVKLAAALFHRKRVGRPVLPVHRHHIGVAGEHDPATILRPDRRPKIGLGLLFVEGEAAFDPDLRQFLPHEFDQLQIGIARGRVEGDELAQSYRCSPGRWDWRSAWVHFGAWRLAQLVASRNCH